MNSIPKDYIYFLKRKVPVLNGKLLFQKGNFFFKRKITFSKGKSLFQKENHFSKGKFTYENIQEVMF